MKTVVARWVAEDCGTGARVEESSMPAVAIAAAD